MKQITSYEAKSRFTEVLRETAEGTVFVITRNGKPLAELRRYASPVPLRKRGMMKSSFGPIPPEFHQPLDCFQNYQ